MAHFWQVHEHSMQVHLIVLNWQYAMISLVEREYSQLGCQKRMTCFQRTTLDFYLSYIIVVVVDFCMPINKMMSY